MDRARRRWDQLDGLRAIAVIAVIAFHLDVGWAGGGFLGVDVFFVISGFLITTLLIDERDRTGQVSLGGFWSRRVRRLAPPAIVMILASLLATYAWFVPERWSTIRGDAVSSLFWVANWRFIHEDAGYFADGLGPSPLEHMWSLAVEEQFYLVWPLAMVAALWLWRRRSATPAVVLGAAALASALWMALLYDPADVDRVYFGTDARAQQLLVGAALAWTIRRWPSLTSTRVQRRLRPIVLTAGALLLTLMVVADGNSAWLYRGGFLAASLAAAVVVLAARSGSTAVSALSWRPLVAVGERSYGLYLWHWPVIVFVGPAIGLALDGAPLLALRIALIVVLAEASHRVVELPARRARRPGAAVAGWAAAAVFVGVVAVTVLVPPDGRTLSSAAEIRPEITLPERVASRAALDPAPAAGRVATAGLGAAAAGPPSPSTPPVPVPDRPIAADVLPPRTAGVTSDVETAPPPVEEPAAEEPALEEPAAEEPAAEEPAAEEPALEEPSGDDEQPTSILVYGDSTAFVFVQGAPEPDDDWVIAGYATPGCGIVPGRPLTQVAPVSFDVVERCARWRAGWRGAIEYFDADIAVVMAGAWAVLDHEVDDREVRFPSPEWHELVTGAVRDIVDAIDGPTRRIVLLRLPCMESVEARTAARNEPERVAAYNAILEGVAAEHPHVEIARLDDLLCPGGAPLRDVGGEAVRYDGVHLTTRGVRHGWEWMFAVLGSD